MKAKIISITLIIILTLVQIAPAVTALTTPYDSQSADTTSGTVKFDIYFKDQNGQKTYTKQSSLYEKDTLYLYVKVEEGYIKNTIIELENPNFSLIQENGKYEEIEKIEGNKITLNKIRNGEEIELEIPIIQEAKNQIDANYFQKETTCYFKANQVKNDGRTVEVAKETKITKSWKGEAKAKLEQEITKYIVEEDKITIEQKIKTSLEKDALPIKKERIKIQIPEINEKAIQGIYINGQKQETPKDGELTITKINQIENGKIEWQKGKQSEYVLTYIYESAPSKEQSVEGEIKRASKTNLITLNTDLEITAYNLEESIYEAQSTKQGTLTSNIGKLITLNKTQTAEIQKGYLYTNETTQYEENYEIGISKINANGIKIETQGATYQDGSKTIATFKNTQVNKKEFDQMLGEKGIITITDENENKIATITNKTKVENGNYKVEYLAENIKIELSETQTIGKITIKNAKQIKENKTKEELKSLKEIETKTILTYENIVEEKTGITILKEPTTQIEASLGTKQFTTVEENKNVEMKLVLKSNDITCKLQKNPEITIKMPEEIEKIQFTEAAKLLFTDELKVAKATYIEKTKEIKINLEGEQTKYIDTSIANGTTIILNLNITLKKLTPSGKGIIEVSVANEEETVVNQIDVEYQAPIGMVAINKLKGYEDGEEIEAVNQQEATGTISLNGKSKEAEAEIVIINNNKNTCKNIRILGRTPFEGNKSIITGEDLGSTFTAELKSRLIQEEGIAESTVLYSTNENATEDLSNDQNMWEANPQDLSKIKSYLIILAGKEMQIGEKISYKYKVTIPEGLRPDEKTYGTFTVYYDNVIIKQTQPSNVTNNVVSTTPNTTNNLNIVNNNTQILNTTNHISETTTKPHTQVTKTQETLIPSRIQAPLVGIATPNIENVELTIEADVKNGEAVKEGSIINYKAQIKNIGKETLKNVTLSIPVPQGTVLREFIKGDSYTNDRIEEKNASEKMMQIQKLEPNKTYTLEMQIKVNEKTENQNAITCNATASMEGYKILTSNVITNPIKEGYIVIDLFTKLNQDKTYKEGEQIQYIAYIQNVKTTEPTRNVVIRGKIPDELEYVEASYIEGIDKDKNQVTYNKETKEITWEIGKIAAKEQKGIVLNCKIRKNAETIKMKLEGETAESVDKITSNEITRYVEKAKLEVKHTSSKEDTYLNVGEKINYYIEIKNTGNTSANNVEIKYEIPKEIEKTKIKIGNENEKEIEDKKITISGYKIEAGESLLITIEGEVAKLEKDAKGTIELKTKASITADDIEKIETNEITHKIKVIDQKNPSINIEGIAWEDMNRDGIKDENEKTLKNIKVLLITKKEVEKVKEVKTNKNGEYIFKDVEEGEYIVVFEYDNEKYEITKYQVENAEENKTSKAATTQKIVLKSGENITGAITNIIKVGKVSLTNINLGIREKAKFDLKLEKKISKITVQTASNTVNYNYETNPKELAKIEIASKDVKGANIIIEYTIIVKNEGNIEGEAREIVDIKPKDLKFNSELNKNWYQAEDGKLYTKALEGKEIKPGETKEIKIILTKELTENNLGTTMNEAKIEESYNKNGLKDEKANEKGSADIIISIKTGKIETYIIIGIVVIATLGAGTYLIKKYV